MNDASRESLAGTSTTPDSNINHQIYNHDWSNTSLGPVESWPKSLVRSVSSCVNASLPVVLWWGPNLIKIYNEAFARLFCLGPTTLGTPGWNGLPDSLKSLEAIIAKVVHDGIAIEHQPPIEDLSNYTCMFTNVPVFDSDDSVAGIYSTAIVNANNAINQGSPEAERRFRKIVDASDLGAFDYNLVNDVLVLSEKCKEIYGLNPDDSISFDSFINHTHPDDRSFLKGEITKALDPANDNALDVGFRIINKDKIVRWIRLRAKVYVNIQQQPEQLVGTIADVTDERHRELLRSEHELKMLLTLQASNMGTYEWDMISQQFHYTQRLAEIFGFTGNETPKRNEFTDRIHPDDLDRRIAAHEEAIRTGKLFYEVRVIMPDNSIRWIRANGEVIYNDAKQPLKMYGTILDITETRSQAESLEDKVRERTRLLEQKNEELKLSEERYYKMTEEVEDYAIILLDKDGTILNWNKGAQKIKGYTEVEIVGKNFEIFYLEEDRRTGLPKSIIGQARENGRAMHEGWRKRKDGTRFWGSIVITALHDEKDNVIGFTKVTRDLTERKLAEDLLKQHAVELESKNRQLEQFAYIASHDLQEPLRKIQTFIHVLERRMDNPEARDRYFQKINAAAKRMAELIQSVLNYSRLSQSDVVYASTDLNEVLENVKIDYELLIAEKNATIVSEKLPTIRGISLQISQLFSNLIGNALKFSSDPPVITVTAEKVDGRKVTQEIPSLDALKNYIKLTFTDNGIGFDQQYADKIFTIFQRLNRKEDYAGTGIGLALCKKIVDNHRGYIKAHGKLGHGATFTVYLPE